MIESRSGFKVAGPMSYGLEGVRILVGGTRLTSRQ